MKRLAVGLALLLSFAGMAFAQNDFTVLATVKLDKNESITLKNLKSRTNFIQKQYDAYRIKITEVDQKKTILDNYSVPLHRISCPRTQARAQVTPISPLRHE